MLAGLAKMEVIRKLPIILLDAFHQFLYTINVSVNQVAHPYLEFHSLFIAIDRLDLEVYAHGANKCRGEAV